MTLNPYEISFLRELRDGPIIRDLAISIHKNAGATLRGLMSRGLARIENEYRRELVKITPIGLWELANAETGP